MRTDTSPGRTSGMATESAASSPGAVSTMAFMAALIAPSPDPRIPFEDLWQVLGEGRPGHHHVTARRVRILLQFRLNMRQVTDQIDALGFRRSLQLRDQRQGL